ncbi:MAG: hypothetical protein KAR42_14970 [candidate division Zixibacteria bacterium]|nr:hypothetical protein [candidate division Zixibacteria bacterium]
MKKKKNVKNIKVKSGTKPKSKAVGKGKAAAKTKKKASIKSLSFVEVLEIIGCSERSLKTWRSKDKTLPVMKVEGRLHFDPLKLLDWLIITSREDYASKLNGWLKENGVTAKTKKKPAAKKKSGSAKTKSSGKDSQGEDNKNSGSDRKAFKFSFRFDKNKPVDIFAVKQMNGALLKAMTSELDGADYATIAINAKTLATLVEGYRKLEASCIEIDEQLQNVIPISAVEKFHGELLTKVKTDIRALPGSIADRIATMKSPEKIAEYLKKEIDDCLRHLSKDIDADTILGK